MSSVERDFEGKVAVVTGGGSGIGRGTAHILARRGASVAIIDLRPDSAEKVAGEIRAAGGAAIHCYVDVAVSEEVKAAFELVEKTFGRLDVLVNNAGHAHESLVEEMSDEDWDRMMAVHIGGTFKCTRAAIPLLKRQGGAIVNTSSTYGLVGWERWAHYSAAKAAVLGFTKSLAKELAPHKIRVNAVAPGSVMTPIQGDTPKSVLQQRGQSIPLKRMGEPEDIGELTAFLVSERASFITGQVVSANGGAIIVGI